MNLPIEILFNILEYFIKGINKPNKESIINENISKVRLVCSLWNDICVDNFFKTKINHFINYNKIGFNYLNLKSNNKQINMFNWENYLILDIKYIDDSIENKIKYNCYILIYDVNDFTIKYKEQFDHNLKIIHNNNLLFLYEPINYSMVNVINLKMIDNSILTMDYSFLDSKKIKNIIQFTQLNETNSSKFSNLFSSIGDNHIKIWEYNNNISDFDKLFIKIDDCLLSIYEGNIKKCFVCNKYLLYITDNKLIIHNILENKVTYIKNNCDDMLIYENYFLILDYNNNEITLLSISNIIEELCKKIFSGNLTNSNYNTIYIYLNQEELNYFIFKNGYLYLFFDTDIIIYNINNMKECIGYGYPFNSEDSEDINETQNPILINNQNQVQVSFESQEIINKCKNSIYENKEKNEIYYLTFDYLTVIKELKLNWNCYSNLIYNCKLPIVSKLNLIWDNYIILSNSKIIYIYVLHKKKLILTKTINPLLKANEEIIKFYIDKNNIIINTNLNIIIYQKF